MKVPVADTLNEIKEKLNRLRAIGGDANNKHVEIVEKAINDLNPDTITNEQIYNALSSAERSFKSWIQKERKRLIKLQNKK